MEDIEKRLKDATDNCLTSHAEWSKNKKESDAREKLMEAVHELRKVAARLEIEIAISERDEMAAKPIPIPPHRSSNKRRRPEDDDTGNNGNSGGNDRPAQQGGGGNPQESSGGGHGGENRPPRRKLGGSGSHGGGGGRDHQGE